MAFLKFGSALLTDVGISINKWGKLISQTGLSRSRVKLASEKLSSEFPSDDYLLSHATIIASIKLDKANTSLSKFKEYLITPESAKYVNKNLDCWTSGVLKNSYHTFRYVPNYVEHIQVPSLSKGRVIDSVLREVDDTTMVDILVATHKKHNDIIKKIENGYFGGMSMGSIVKFTICSQCGKVIHDDTEKCIHIRYSLGDTFTDNEGKDRVIAEVCGHESCPDSNIFIEASWVKDPAFTGAVVSMVLNPSKQQLKKLKAAFQEDEKEVIGDGFKKAASFRYRYADDEADAELDEMIESEDETASEDITPDFDEDEDIYLTSDFEHDEEDEVEEEENLEDSISKNISDKVLNIVENIVDNVLDKVKYEIVEVDPLKSDVFNGQVEMLNDSVVRGSFRRREY